MAAERAVIRTYERQAAALLRLLRVRQWVKNAFVAATNYFTPALVSPQIVRREAAGSRCVCALASAAYILNDYLDRDADRLHETKRHRPLAAGAASPIAALALM